MTAMPEVLEPLLRDAALARQRGEAAQERRLLDRAVAAHPADPRVNNACGMRALADRDAALAVTYFTKAAEADPREPALQVNLATAFRALGDVEGERRSLQRALDIDQLQLMPRLRMAELLERTGAGMAAMPHWQGLVAMLTQLDDRGPDAERVLAIARERLAGHTTALSNAIDAALTPARDRLSSQERRRFERGVDAMLGRQRIYTNACHGLHFPFLPADEFFDPAHFAWLPGLEAATPAIIAEFRALYDAPDSGFAPYVSMDAGSPSNRWTLLDRSADWSARYLWRLGARDDVVCARCPRTAAALDGVPRVTLPGQAPSAFFSVLKPGTRLPAHTGVSNIRAIVHLPLVVPPGCGFRVGGETREWRVGEAFAFDDTIEHEAWNDGPDPRAVLILDTWNPHLSPAERDMLQALFGAIALSGSMLGAAAD